jgi:flagellar basal body rod protein FlgG
MVRKAYHNGNTMINGIHSALSALNAFSTKLAVASNNVANANSDGFKKKRATIQEGQHGGVEVSIQEARTPLNPASNNESPGGNDKEPSNVELAEETTHMILATEGFESNLRYLEAQDEMKRTVLDIIG